MVLSFFFFWKILILVVPKWYECKTNKKKKKKKGGARVLRVLAFRRFLVDRIEALQSDQQY